MDAGTKGKMAEQKKAGFAGRQTESLPARLLKDMRKNWILYVMILPVVVYYIIFAYAPIYGIQLAFKDYIVKKGIWGSPWIGMENFTRFFSSYNFGLLLKNTIGISVYSILVGFRADAQLSEEQISEKNGADGFLCALFYLDRSYVRYDHYFSESGYGDFQYDQRLFRNGKR